MISYVTKASPFECDLDQLPIDEVSSVGWTSRHEW